MGGGGVGVVEYKGWWWSRGGDGLGWWGLGLVGSRVGGGQGLVGV